ncbi:FAD-dependent oxidoreductase [bacterium]|nr:FAD-dependent oxidoreductase [bacterium]
MPFKLKLHDRENETMKRRDFSKGLLTFGIGAQAACVTGGTKMETDSAGNIFIEPPRHLPIRRYDVVIAGGGTAGVVAALAAARQGVKTMLIEKKGYTGGTITEGGTALHSFYNLWKAFPEAEKRQVVKGIPQEIIDRLMQIGACTGHAEMSRGYNYDSVCTAIDTELYKLVTHEMLDEAGVFVAVNTMVVGAIMDGSRVRGVITESVSGREAVYAESFVDCTAYGDLSAHAGAKYTEPNDYPVCNSIGVANVDVDKLYDFINEHDAVSQLAHGMRSGQDDQIVRIQGRTAKLPEGFHQEARAIGMSMTTTTVHDNYLMFIKLNIKMPVSPTSRDAAAKTELELRKRQFRALQLFRKYVPGCEKALIARTSPQFTIRRGRLIACDYDISHEDVIEGRHFEDDIMAYGFHDSAPRLQIKNGGTYGVPFKALRVKGIENLMASGMLITADHRAHMSTRNTVCSMGQGQRTGTAAALCVKHQCTTRELPYAELRRTLEKDGVYFEA